MKQLAASVRVLLPGRPAASVASSGHRLGPDSGEGDCVRAFASAFTRKQKPDRSRPLAPYELRAVVTTERSHPSDTDPAYWWKSGSRLPWSPALAARRFRLRVAENLRLRRLADLV